ncbi:MAG: YggS family pyridoxal phosphate-dependent enzyme [Hyphomicrobiaceae bacterium]
MIDAAQARLADVRRDLDAAASDANRKRESVQLVAVSKTFPAEAILPVLEAGQRVFGENRVQEAAGKWPDLRKKFPDIELHLIGPLQSNKTRDAVALFDVIHTVDRPKIAKTLAAEMERTGRNLPVFIQVNTGAEPQKAGIAPEELSAFLELTRDELGLNVAGLMCIPPVEDEPAVHFGFLATLAERHGLEGLSMGMSSDYPAAIRFGATHVRVGSAIFGPRG